MGYGNYRDPFAGRKPQYTVGAGERLELTFVVLPGESRDIDVAIDLVGEGAEVSLKGLYLCGGDERVNFRILMHHRAPCCVSRQLFNGIAGGSSRVTFEGRIIVAPDAQKTEAYQENHNIVLSDRAHAETMPQLEIYADDVKCSHGATVGRLDEEALFYMRTRGVPEKDAKVLQMLSFLSPVTPEDKREIVEKAVLQLV
ncbi:MAG: SufD family Fe-S cluster assembly protein [Bacteroidales bacterium]|nr:SufD family Fe-S cluster assembly protein [Bacteroidales bacterium]MBR3096969.1 SufD family Fe-S cluster assembly protein [Bacteroidales bacterium]